MQKRDKWSMVSLDKHLLRAIQSIFIVNPSSTYLTNNINDKKKQVYISNETMVELVVILDA